MKKYFLPIVIVVIIIILVAILYFKNYNKIDDNYYLSLKGGSGEIVYTTYFYWEHTQQAKYVNTESITESWGSGKWKEKVTKRGTIDFMQEIYEVAKSNNAFDYAVINQDIEISNMNYKKGDTITIDELYELFGVIGLK